MGCIFNTIHGKPLNKYIINIYCILIWLRGISFEHKVSQWLMLIITDCSLLSSG